jgi:rhodanese-related sulfurtransferase
MASAHELKQCRRVTDDDLHWDACSIIGETFGLWRSAINMTKKAISGLLRVSAVILMIVLASAWIGFSINRSFIKGPRTTTMTFKEVDGHPVLISTEDSKPASSLPRHERIELAELKPLVLERKAMLVDGRAVKDYEAGHIPGALNLPASQLEVFFPDFSSRVSRDQLVVAYCGGHDCSLAQTLAKGLAEKGYRHIKVYYGGYSDWFLNGNPVQMGKDDNAASQ